MKLTFKLHATTIKVCVEKLFCTHQNEAAKELLLQDRSQRTACLREEKGEIPNIDLVIKCNNHKHGCTTQNNLRALFDHEKDCDYKTLKMTKCSQCKQWIESSQQQYLNCL